MEIDSIVSNESISVNSNIKEELSPVLPEIAQPNPMECIEYLNTLSQTLALFIREAGSNIDHSDCLCQANKLNDVLQWFSRARESIPREPLTIEEQEKRISNLKYQIEEKTEFFNNLIGKPKLKQQEPEIKKKKDYWMNRAVVNAIHKRKLDNIQLKLMKGEQISDDDIDLSDSELYPHLKDDINGLKLKKAEKNLNEKTGTPKDLTEKNKSISTMSLQLESKTEKNNEVSKNESAIAKNEDEDISVFDLLRTNPDEDISNSMNIEMNGDVFHYKAQVNSTQKDREIKDITAKSWNYYRPKLEIISKTKNSRISTTADIKEELDELHQLLDIGKSQGNILLSSATKRKKIVDIEIERPKRPRIIEPPQEDKGVSISIAEQRTIIHKYKSDELYPEVSNILKELDII